MARSKNPKENPRAPRAPHQFFSQESCLTNRTRSASTELPPYPAPPTKKREKKRKRQIKSRRETALSSPLLSRQQLQKTHPQKHTSWLGKHHCTLARLNVQGFLHPHPPSPTPVLSTHTPQPILTPPHFQNPPPQPIPPLPRRPPRTCQYTQKRFSVCSTNAYALREGPYPLPLFREIPRVDRRLRWRSRS